MDTLALSAGQHDSSSIISATAASCNALGKTLGMTSCSEEDLKHAERLGYDMLTCWSDLNLLHAGIQAELGGQPTHVPFSSRAHVSPPPLLSNETPVHVHAAANTLPPMSQQALPPSSPPLPAAPQYESSMSNPVRSQSAAQAEWAEECSAWADALEQFENFPEHLAGKRTNGTNEINGTDMRPPWM